MDIASVVVVALVVIGNIIAWVYTYGKLNERVRVLKDTLDNGLCEKVDGISRHVAELEGTVNTFIKLVNKDG